ncbi:hypothetical protein BDZ97DRAFT_1796815 [Flammula alnicola]|nr:hypothetical protein BDZ97DRAFT_1796815 [Flammula alnicola]
MSSKRGRKRNDNLPPNRARDVQRAFRARRAAHLQALEQRVSELEEENDCLRSALRLPPSTRPPLGKGPTGKDKAKSFPGSHAQSLGFTSSRESSAANSPPSRASSASPSGITISMSSSQPMTVIDDGNWNDTLLLNDHPQRHHHPDDVPGPSDMPYHIAPMTAPVAAPLAVKPLQYSYNHTFPSSSRSLSNSLYAVSPIPYSHSSDRPMGSSYGVQNFNIRGDIRDEPSRQQYSYNQSFTPHDPNLHSQTPSPNIHSHLHNHHSTQEESPLPYAPHRRSLTDPQGFSLGEGFPHLPNPTHLQHNPRPPDYMREQDNHNMHLTVSSRSGAYGPDGRLNPIS